MLTSCGGAYLLVTAGAPRPAEQRKRGQLMIVTASEYAQQWARYLRAHRWDLIGHFTFPDNVSERFANVIWHRYTHRINRFQYGVGYTKHRKHKSIQAGKHEIRWAKAGEQQDRGTIHFHAVIAGIQKALQASIQQATQAWEKLTGGGANSAVVLPYDPTKGGIEYMCKKLDAHRRPMEMGGQP